MVGWSRSDGWQKEREIEENDMSHRVLSCFKPHVVGLTGTWLKSGTVVQYDGYKWLRHRRKISGRANRGTGGVGG